MEIDEYNKISNGAAAFYPQERGLIAVWGRESTQFLNGLITNDVASLEDGGEMLAAFPNAQGRLLAIVRVRRDGDRFLFETEAATRDKVFQNLYRFTFAGDFFVEDLSESLDFFSTFNFQFSNAHSFSSLAGRDFFAAKSAASEFEAAIASQQAVRISGELWETLRIECGIPLYGIDCDETTIVPELGLEGLISYNKGCYIGQEIIARIHFRGHVAKRLTGLICDGGIIAGSEVRTGDGKNAGRVTSVTFSPKIGKTIALAYVRYDFLADGTELFADENRMIVKTLPFIQELN
ncbi:MAG: folate-binding protein YgfZ [Acidobacteria bacterium]|nr:folate-binding protein YgfZ [Acidobacteriota bacterium]